MSLEENKPVKVLRFPIGYLFACIPFFDLAGKHEMFSCITIADGYLGATDGAAMIIVEDIVFNGCDYLLDGLAISKLKEVTDSIDITDFELRIEGESLATAVLNGGDFTFPIHLKDYERKNLKKVDIEKPKLVSLEADQMPYFNPEYLNAFMCAGEFLCGHDLRFMQILPSGKESPIYIDITRNMHGILMPAKFGGVTDYKNALHAEMLS